MADKKESIGRSILKSLWIVIPLSVIAAIVTIIAFAGSFYIQLEDYERGVVFNFGTVSDKVLQPGPSYKVPYDIRKVVVVDVVNDRKLQIGFSESQSGDKTHNEQEALTLTKYGNLVDLEMEVNYNINNPIKFVINVEDPELTVRQSSESALRMIVGRRNIDEVLTENKADITDQIQEKLQSILDSYDIGIHITRVLFVKAVNPSQVIQAFEDVENAKQDSAKAFLDAQRYANQKLPQARGIAQREIENAKGFAAALIATAKGDSSQFSQILSQYTKYKDVTRKRMYLETMEEILPKAKKIIIDDETKSTNIFPLGKL